MVGVLHGPGGVHEARSSKSDETRKGKCSVYVVAAKVIADDWPKGNCLACGLPLRSHEKRVSSLAPPGTGYVIDEAVLRVG